MRVSLSVLVATALVAVVFVAPGVTAQEAPSCGTVSVAATEPASAAALALIPITVDVTNEAQGAEVTVAVRANFDDAATAAGWTVNPAETTLTIAPGATGSTTFDVQAPDAADSQASLNFLVGGECTANGQAFPLPGIAVVPEVTRSVTVSTVPKSGFELPDFGALADIPPAYLLGLVGVLVIALGAVVAARSRTLGFEVRCAEPDKRIQAGRGVSFPLEVRNRGRQPDTARFDVGEVPPGWSAFMALSELALAPGEARTLWLMVRAPETAAKGQAAVVPVVVDSKANPRKDTRVAVRAEVVPGGGQSDDEVEATRVG